jgi:hypothetical protein
MPVQALPDHEGTVSEDRRNTDRKRAHFRRKAFDRHPVIINNVQNLREKWFDMVSFDVIDMSLDENNINNADLNDIKQRLKVKIIFKN